MSNHTHEAVHTIHRPGKNGVEVIAAGTSFTPADAKQAEYLEAQGAARKRKVEKVAPAPAPAPVNGNAGKKDGKGEGKKSGDAKDDDDLV